MGVEDDHDWSFYKYARSVSGRPRTAPRKRKKPWTVRSINRLLRELDDPSLRVERRAREREAFERKARARVAANAPKGRRVQPKERPLLGRRVPSLKQDVPPGRHG